MRNGWRLVGVIGLWLPLLGGMSRSVAAPVFADSPQGAQSGPIARMTVELVWSVPPAIDPPTVRLSVSEGRILGVIEAPDPGDPIGAPGVERLRANAQGSWQVAEGRTRSGRVRIRVEAPLGATLNVEGAGQIVPFTLAGFIDGPQRSAPPARIELSVERLSWDTIEVGEEGDGLVAPGSAIPLTIGLNVLSTDVGEVQLRLIAKLRPMGGGEPVWEQEAREVVATNSATAPTIVLPLRIPEGASEGTYALDFQAIWEPVVAPTTSRLGLTRWLAARRRKASPGRGEASRRLTLVVLDPKGQAKPEPPRTPSKGGDEAEVDLFDFAKPRGHRPSASGKAATLTIAGPAWRVPAEALVESTRRDRLRGWIPRGTGEPITLAPADSEGLHWTAVGLKSARPDRPHRLTLTVQGNSPSALGLAMVAPGVRPRLVLDAIAAPPLARLDPAKPGVASFSWIVWPDASEPVLILVNRDPREVARLGSVTLTELTDIAPGDGVVPSASGPRWVGLSVTPRQVVERFGGGGVDPWTASRNLARYAATLGANALVLPDRLADRSRRLSLGGQGSVDPLGPDRLDLALRLLDRHGLAAWVELDLEGPLAALPAPESAEALAEGLIRLDRRGKLDGPPTYHPIHPKVREALARRVAGTAGRRKDRGNLAGVVVRLGRGPTTLGRPDSGLDDATFSRFVGETFAPGLARGIPGLDASAEDRHEIRAQYVEGPGRAPWLAWRAKQVASLYVELVQAARGAAPGASLAVVTPGLDDGPVGDETRRLDLLGLGPDQAWRSVGLDFAAWPVGDDAPIVWRGVTPGDPGELDHDLAASPDLDEPVMSRPQRGLALSDASRASLAGLPLPGPGDDNLALTARGAASRDESLGHALAAFDARWIMLTPDAVAGREDRIRRFARLVAVLPAPAETLAEPRRSKGVAARAATAPGGLATVVSLVNDTPYPILLETVLKAPASARVHDLGRSVGLNAESVPEGKRVVIALPPFGASALSVDAADVVVVKAEPHPGAGVVEDLKARSELISATLVRLNRPAPDDDRSTPANSGFEPPPGSEPRVARTGLSIMGDPPAPTFAANGWRLSSEGVPASVEIDGDRPRSGQGSLRLSATAPLASVASDSFEPIGRPSLQIQFWLRADRPETKARIWVEGQAAGQPFSRRLEVVASTDWRPIALRASGIPGGGLDSARIRFELPEAGKLWIDDLSVAGPLLTEPERLNARRDLLAALSAFREGRYGDFSRLAGSHWARPVASDGDGTMLAPALAERPSPLRTGTGDGAGAGSALPTPRRLR